MLVLVAFGLGLLVTSQLLEALDLLPRPLVEQTAQLFPLLQASKNDVLVAYFGLTVLVSPLPMVYLMWRDPIGTRWRIGLYAGGDRLLFRRLVLMYGLLPVTLLGLLALLTSVDPGAFDASNRSRGAKILQAMDDSTIMMFLFGPTISLGLWFTGWICLVPLVGPWVQRGRQADPNEPPSTSKRTRSTN